VNAGIYSLGPTPTDWLSTSRACACCVAYWQVWPNLGLHYAMLAKLEMLLEQPGAAARAAEAAAAVLCVTHGGSCGVVHEACRIRYEAEQELAAARMAE